MSSKIFLIGDLNEYSNYIENINNIDFLPLKNLPITYFPFYYNENESSINKLKSIVPLLKNYNNDENKIIKYGDGTSFDIEIDKMFNLLTNIEEEFQPYNNNNISYIRAIVIIFWILLLFLILKYLSFILNEWYSYVILGLIIILLIFCSAWAILITSKSF